MLKILFICHRFPHPPEGGGKIRALHIIRHLIASGHEVTLCSLTRSPSEELGVDEIVRLGARVEVARVKDWVQSLKMLLLVPTTQPSSFGFFRSAALAKIVERLLSEQSWDLVFAHCSSMGTYVSHVSGVPKIMDFADMDSQKWMDYSREKRFPATLVYTLEGAKLRRQEALLARAFDLSTTISVNELATLRSVGTDKLSDWFPNGVDLDFFSPAETACDPDLIVFVGRMDYYPNEQAMLWFCVEVWPRLRSRRASLKLRIVGANPPRSVRRLAELGGVEVTGFVDDVRPHVNTACLSVAPLRIARGMQNKVLESMAMGVPVVTSGRVARGLGFGEDSPVPLAETPEQYVNEILSIVEQPALRARLAEASRSLVESEYSWESAMGRLDPLMERAIASHQPT